MLMTYQLGDKAGRPPVGADFWERLNWTLWQCWSVHPQDSEARRAHDLALDLRGHQRSATGLYKRFLKAPKWRQAIISRLLGWWIV